MTATMAAPRVNAEQLRAAAWNEYLEATHEQPLDRYREVEPWAWAKLQQRLRAIGPKESARRTDAVEGSSPAGAPAPLEEDAS